MADHWVRDKVIAITGAASGIGLALSKTTALPRRQALNRRQPAGRPPLATSAPSLDLTSVFATVLDVSDPQEVDTWISTTVQHFGRLDGAANMAGIGGYVDKLIVDLKRDDWDRVIAVNLTGGMNCIRAQLRHVTDGGSIVNAASTAGLTGAPIFSPCTVSKHGVIGLKRCAAKRLVREGFALMRSARDGTVDTPMMRINPDEIVNRVASMSALGRIWAARRTCIIEFLLSPASSYMSAVRMWLMAD